MQALALNDPKWLSLNGGYGIPFDASRPIRELSSGASPEGIWVELWDELHHQGDVGEASYAAVPALVEVCVQRGMFDWNLFSLASTIEACRETGNNPIIPEWLAPLYVEAWRALFEFGLEGLRRSNDELLVRSVLGVIAQHKGLKLLGRLLSDLDASEIEELYEQHYE